MLLRALLILLATHTAVGAETFVGTNIGLVPAFELTQSPDSVFGLATGFITSGGDRVYYRREGTTLIWENQTLGGSGVSWHLVDEGQQWGPHELAAAIVQAPSTFRGGLDGLDLGQREGEFYFGVANRVDVPCPGPPFGATCSVATEFGWARLRFSDDSVEMVSNALTTNPDGIVVGLPEPAASLVCPLVAFLVMVRKRCMRRQQMARVS